METFLSSVVIHLERKNKSVSELEPRNTIDELTGLPNFAAFIAMAQHVLNDPTERKDIAFVYFNLENFRSYNEAYGLAAGNDCLVTVARTIEAFFPQELCGRIASDHFGVLTDKADLEYKVVGVCDEMLPFRMDTHLQMRAGIYFPTDNDFDAHSCLNKAKVACDSIRKKYDSMFGYYDSAIDERYQRERFIIDKLEDAIQQRHITPYYQAVVRVMTGEVSGYEALARWDDPEIGKISPGDFVPILEKYQMIRKLDLFIFESVCMDIREKLDTGAVVVPVSINLSQQDFLGGDIVSEVDDTIKRYGISSDLFHMEVTESIFATEPGKVGDCIERFRKLGYQVWLDDFGSGYSSLNMLKDYKFDCIKLDMIFMRGFEENHETRVILQAMINMAKNLGIQTVAEGVETQKAADYLRKIGCENIQGFLYSRPEKIEVTFNSQLKRESEGMRKYYTKIGKVNLFSANPLDLTGGNVDEEGLPMAIMEMRKDRLIYLSCNPAYLKHLEDLNLNGLDEAEDFLNQGKRKLPSIFVNAVNRCRNSGKQESCDYILNGQNCTFQARHITTYRNRSAYLITSLNMSVYKQAARSEKQQALLKFIYTQYNKIDILDPEKLTVENIYINSSEYTIADHIMSSDEYSQQFINESVHELDRDRFVNFFTKEEIVDKISNTNKEYITEYFRIKNKEGYYRWQKFDAIYIEVKKKPMFMICISDIDFSRVRMLRDMDEKLQEVPRNPAFMWLSSRDFSKILGYKSYNDFLDGSFYFEVNLTQNTIIDMHLSDVSEVDSSAYKDRFNDYEGVVQDMINTQVDIQDIEAASIFYDRINIIREYQAGNEIGSLEFRSYAKGKMAWLHCTYQVVKSQETGELFAYFLNYDVDDYNRKLLKEKKAVETDFLTGLLNRYSAVPVMRDYLFNNPESSSALIMMDLDDFKFVNDTYGHGCGDEMLKAVADKLRNKFELYGIVCRLGGDEFLGLLMGKSKEFVDEFLAELLAKPVTIEYEGNIVKCSMSAGYALYPSQGKEYHHLYEMADKAMYSAKHSGKARYCIYSHNETEGKASKIELTTDEILETMPAAYAVCEVSTNNPILLVNSAFTRFFRCSSVTQLHKFCEGHVIKLVATQDRERVIDAVYDGFDNYSGQTTKMTINFRRYDGTELKSTCFIRFARTREGKRLYVMIV